MKQGVLFDRVVEVFKLGLCRKFTIQDQVADFREGGLFSKLPDRVAPVEKNALIPIDESNLAFAAGRGGEARIECEMVRFCVHPADVDHVRTMRPGKDR